MKDVMTPEHPQWDEFTEALGKALGGLPGRCDGDRGEAGPNAHRHAKQILTKMRCIDIEQSLDFFEDNGGYCDCEILFNVDREI